MIAHLRGNVVAKQPNSAVVECAGVGYEILISIETFGALPAVGAEASVHVHTHVREDQIALFGFSEMREKRMFEKLLLISGIGPKLALTILSGIATDRLIGAIRAGDHAQLVKMPGVGKKTAERVVLELRDKLDELATAWPESAPGGAPAHGPKGVMAQDVVSALVNLGYQRPAAERAVDQAQEKLPEVAGDFEALFRAAMGAMR